MLDIKNVVEEPAQVRRIYDEEALQELASSIKLKGVREPISVKPANAEGKFSINKGHRRYRASLLAGKKKIPAFVQDDSDDWDQVTENLNRDNLRAIEIIEFVAKKKSEGVKQVEIARLLSKPESWVAKHAALVKRSTFVDGLIKQQQANDISVLYPLQQAYKKNAELTEELCNQVIAEIGSISKAEAAKIEARVKTGIVAPEPSEPQNTKEEGGQEESAGSDSGSETKPAPSAKKPSYRLAVEADGEEYFVVVRVPSQDGNLVVTNAKGEVSEISTSKLIILGVKELTMDD